MEKMEQDGNEASLFLVYNNKDVCEGDGIHNWLSER